jgi:glycerophosphoryl diester phosphodiesterase
VIGHRGAASLAPENTMAAFRKARAAGADMFELDVHLSADGVPVVIHDDTLERTTDIEKYYQEWGLGKDVQVSSLPLEKLQRLDAGTWFVEGDPFRTIRSGTVSREDADSYRGEPIPTLDEALRFADENGIAVNVEIKQIPRFYEGIAAKVVAAVGRMRQKSIVLVSSFDHEICCSVKALDPELAVAPLCGERIADPGRYIVEIVGGEVFNPAKSVLGCSDGRPVEDAPVNAADILSAHRRGVAVNVWTVNDRPTMRRLIKAGVDGIITDYPHVLREVVDEARRP